MSADQHLMTQVMAIVKVEKQLTYPSVSVTPNMHTFSYLRHNRYLW